MGIIASSDVLILANTIASGVLGILYIFATTWAAKQRKRLETKIDENTTETKRAVVASEKAVVLGNGIQTPALRAAAASTAALAASVPTPENCQLADNAKKNLADHEASIAQANTPDEMQRRLPNDPHTSHGQ
jgi:hypothetical protein